MPHRFSQARNLELSIDNERVFTKAHPSDMDPIIIEIKPGGQEDLKIEVFSK